MIILYCNHWRTDYNLNLYRPSIDGWTYVNFYKYAAVNAHNITTIKLIKLFNKLELNGVILMNAKIY